ncbi:hypothetical protein [Flavobacterium sp.]|jgi:hypothetical protein|uniref:hypothetical protein n=1 Tax=Flavobacterium sp. TaxID=239 RepID=UPI0037C04A38
MKKLLFFLAFIFTFISCGLEDDAPPAYHFEIMPVENFIVPDTFDYLSTHQIKLFYKKPNSCYDLAGIYFDRYLNERTIGLQCVVLNSTNCEPYEDALYEVDFNFEVLSTETYLFKFYKGKDANGNNIFEEVEIPVNSD